MKIEKIPRFLYSEEFPNDYGIHVITNKFKDFFNHRHEFYEFEYIFEGEITCVKNGVKYHMKKGDLAFITPLDLHSYEAVSDADVKTITVHFNADNLSSDFFSLAQMPTFIMKCDSELATAFETIEKENRIEAMRYLSLKNILDRIFILILRKQKNIKKSNLPAEIAFSIGFINQNFNSTLKLEDLSKKCGYTDSHFCRQFKKYTGKSFVEYPTDLRVRHAVNMLSSQKISVTQVCYECGFGSVRNFNRIFRQKYGCSPGEYAQKNFINQ